MMKTRVTELLGVQYPVIQGGMQWVGRAELASAVSNAGGFGILTALTQPSPEALEQEIKRCRDLTDKPFGVNLTILPSITTRPYEAYLDVVLGSNVRVLETAGNNPKAFIGKAHSAGVRVMHKCTSVRHALSAERAGVDAIEIDGFECAGHTGEDDVPGLLLIPAAASALGIPVVACGGIGDGRGMAAALMLGAEGISMGTRFCATREAPIHQAVKEALVAATERDTALIFRKFGNTVRILRNAIADEVGVLERREGVVFEDIRHLVAGIRGQAALEAGNVNGGVVGVGQVVGLIHDIPTVAELIERIVTECHASIAAAARMFTEPLENFSTVQVLAG